MLAAWLAAGALALWACVALVRVPEPVGRPSLPAGIETVIIGSSLTGRGLPFSPPEDPAAGVGYVSWIVNGISASRTLELAETAIDQGAKRIFVEFSPFAGVREAAIPGLPGDLTVRLRQLTRALNRGVTALTGQSAARIWSQPKRPIRDRDWLEERRIDRRPVAPGVLFEPERLRDLLRRAERDRITLVLFDPPRSEGMVEWFRRTPLGDWSAYARNLAGAEGIDLATFPAYPDRYFADPTHLNDLGRARFTREFADRFDVPR